MMDMMARDTVEMFRSDRLRSARLMRGLTQDELAERVGSGPVTINRYENQKSTPGPDMLAALALALEVSTDWLLGLTDNPQGHLTTADLTADEWKALTAFRDADLEGIIRAFLQRKQHEPGHEGEMSPEE